MGQREYFPCFHSYRRRTKNLTDQEVGRLFRALLEYSETGEAPELTGRESIAFDFIADDIDRARERYDDSCRKNAENIKRRWSKEDTTEYERIQSYEKDTVEYDRIRPHTKDTKAKEKEKVKAKEKKIEYAPLAQAAAQIIGHLNEQTGANYRPESKTTQTKIHARMAEGYTVEDFVAVIDKKCAEWLHDPKMRAYLRPETLFGTKFESYLNAPERGNAKETEGRKIAKAPTPAAEPTQAEQKEFERRIAQQDSWMREFLKDQQEKPESAQVSKPEKDLRLMVGKETEWHGKRKR